MIPSRQPCGVEPQDAAMPIASSSCGSASTTSLVREITVSTQPR